LPTEANLLGLFEPRLFGLCFHIRGASLKVRVTLLDRLLFRARDEVILGTLEERSGGAALRW
jgi:hypothetical protein